MALVGPQRLRVSTRKFTAQRPAGLHALPRLLPMAEKAAGPFAAATTRTRWIIAAALRTFRRTPRPSGQLAPTASAELPAIFVAAGRLVEPRVLTPAERASRARVRDYACAQGVRERARAQRHSARCARFGRDRADTHRQRRWTAMIEAGGKPVHRSTLWYHVVPCSTPWHLVVPRYPVIASG